MITKEEARKLVCDDLYGSTDPSKSEIVIIDEDTIEKEWGWVFFYQSRKFLETDDISDMIFGNAPYIVSNKDGSFQRSGTAESVEEYIRDYEAQLGLIEDYTLILEQEVPDYIGAIRRVADILECSVENLQQTRTQFPRELKTGNWKEISELRGIIVWWGMREVQVRSNYKSKQKNSEEN